MRGRRCVAACLAVAALGLAGATRDPGVRVRVDLERFELVAQDARRPADELVLPIATGSPAHPSPAGHYAPREVVRNPGWKPGAQAREWGAQPVDPSGQGPMGVAKIPLRGDGFALHGGANPLVVGKPVSLGCVRLSDTDMLAFLDWLDRGGALAPARASANGEIHQPLRRPVAFDVR
ncbi:MAG TPA: L,D-transpeptidase [Myxococcota bacterium]|nr:L,D-transpeptidase [Myxococcota bacterium]